MADSEGIVSLEPGQGDAYIQPRSTFDPVQFSRYALEQGVRNRQKALDDQNKKNKDLNKWIDENNPTMKWDIDHQAYGATRMGELQAEAKKAVADARGNLTPQQHADLDRKFDEEKQIFKISDEQMNRFNVANVESRKVDDKTQKDLYTADSKAAVQAWGNPANIGNIPGATPELKDRVAKGLAEAGYKQGGDYRDNYKAIQKFRANNSDLLNPERHWNWLDALGQHMNDEKINEEHTTDFFDFDKNKRQQVKVDKKFYNEDQIGAIGQSLLSEGGKQFVDQMKGDALSGISDADKEKIVRQSLIKQGKLDADGNYTPEYQAELDKLPEDQRAAIKKADSDKALTLEGFKQMFIKKHPDQVDKSLITEPKTNINISNGGNTTPFFVQNQKDVTVTAPDSGGKILVASTQKSVGSMQFGKPIIVKGTKTHLISVTDGRNVNDPNLEKSDLGEVNNVLVDKDGKMVDQRTIDHFKGADAMIKKGLATYQPMGFGSYTKVTYKEDGKDKTETVPSSAIDMLAELMAHPGAKKEKVDFYTPISEVRSGIVNDQDPKDRKYMDEALLKLERMAYDANIKANPILKKYKKRP